MGYYSANTFIIKTGVEIYTSLLLNRAGPSNFFANWTFLVKLLKLDIFEAKFANNLDYAYIRHALIRCFQEI